ncbi:hypothetical protein ACJX0J_006477, partial [Zea mays]
YKDMALISIFTCILDSHVESCLISLLLVLGDDRASLGEQSYLFRPVQTRYRTLSYFVPSKPQHTNATNNNERTLIFVPWFSLSKLTGIEGIEMNLIPNKVHVMIGN